MVVLKTGQVYSFGNNYYAQLGYNFREKNYKENQTRPYLLKSLIGMPVVAVACGDKHSIFRFQSGAIACVGCNANGQIGTGDREEALVPKTMDMSSTVTQVACGSNHSLAISDNGEVYVWGYGKACGSKSDVLSPMVISAWRSKVTKVAGGMGHSMALTASGNVYSWGSGVDGQLGHGDKVLFLSEPQPLKHNKLRGKITEISCGEAFSAAVTENGRLYMWGKNSHTICPEKETGYRVWEPKCVNSRGQSVQSVTCGSWHAVSITGSPEFIRRSDSVAQSVCTDGSVCYSDEDLVDFEDSDSVSTSLNNHQDLCIETTDEVGVLLPSLTLKRDMTSLERDKTRLSLAEFYAPTPDIPREPMHEEEDPELPVEGSHIPISARSTKLVVQVPINKDPQMTTQRDAATSPIPFSSSESESAAQEYVSPAPTKVDSEQTLPHELSESQEARENREFRAKIQKTYNRDEMTKLFLNYERQKTCGMKHPTTVVQISRTSADSFMLPRENTTFTSKQIDFAEIEHFKSRGNNKSPEKLLIQGKSAADGVVRMFESPFTGRSYPDEGPSRLQYMDNTYSPYSRSGHSVQHKFPDGRLMDSPALRSGRHSETTIINLSQFERAASNYAMLVSRASESSLADYARSWAAPETTSDVDNRISRLKNHVKPPQPSNSIPNKNNDANFGLQISRSDTVVAPVKNPAKPSGNKVKDMQRYAKVHNPQGTSFKQDSRIRLGQSFQRKISIPASRAYLANEEPVNNLCVKGQTGSSRRNPMYSSAWRDKTDMDKVVNGQNSSLATDRSSPSQAYPDSHREAEDAVTPGGDRQGETIQKENRLTNVNNNKIQYKPADKFRRGKLVAARNQSCDDTSTVMLKIEPRGVTVSTKDSGVPQVR
ncbi:uncharacterized protein [Argopecten irradians]|uniref:uncharacterized protein isoform X1 n=1 Tax=Argopecten irradians TaxID=31199 RepID=UPI0037107367